MKTFWILLISVLFSGFGWAQPIQSSRPPLRLQNLRSVPQPRYVVPLAPAQYRPATPTPIQGVSSIGPIRGAGRGTAAEISAAEVAKVCSKLNCSGAPVTSMVTRSGVGAGNGGVLVTEHAETECPGCGTTVGASRNLSNNPPNITNRLFIGNMPRPTEGVPGLAARDAKSTLDSAISPFVQRGKKEDPLYRLGQRTARYGLKQVCPFGKACNQENTYTRGAKLQTDTLKYEGTSMRCSTPGCRAEAVSIVGSDGSQSISSWRGEKFWKGSNAIPQRDPKLAKQAGEGAQQLRKMGLNRNTK